MSEGFAGRWVTRPGGVRVPVIVDEPKGGRPRKVTPGAVGRMVDLINWTPETLKAAHAAFERGNRDVYTLAGNREYNRRRGRTNRRGMSATDLRWCEKQAGKWERLVFERTNRMLG